MKNMKQESDINILMIESIEMTLTNLYPFILMENS